MYASFITTFLLASIASVSALSLASIEAISSSSVTPGCYAAYSKEIPECPAASEFKDKKPCSEECVEALETYSVDTILVCRQSFVSTESLLRRLVDGGLVAELCPVTASPTVTSSSYVISGFTTITSASTTSIPSELTLDASAEPTPAVDEVEVIAAQASNASVSSPAESVIPTASGDASPFESGYGSDTTSGGQQDDENAAGSLKAVWASVFVGFSVALGAALL